MHTAVFRTALLTMATQCDKPRPSADGERKRWWKHMVEYYSATKRNDILAYATIYMNLEGTVLNEISQEQNTSSYL